MSETKKSKKIIPELMDVDEPELTQGKTQAEIEAELKTLEEQDAAEDEAADMDELEDDVIPMTDAEMAAMGAETTKKESKNYSAPKASTKVVTPKSNEPINRNKDTNVINKEKTLLYRYPSVDEWTKIHELRPERIVFYFTMTKHEYKELYLCQIKYRTKIVGSTGARVI